MGQRHKDQLLLLTDSVKVTQRNPNLWLARYSASLVFFPTIPCFWLNPEK